jgi:hypothetical protein
MASNRYWNRDESLETSTSVRNAGKFCTAVNNTTTDQQHDWLRQHHLLPPDWELSASVQEESFQVDLTPFLLAAWTRSYSHLKSRQQRRTAERRVRWLEAQIARHAELTWGIPGSTNECVPDWIGHRLVWWPRGLPQGQRIGVVSSRLTRTLERHQAWFAALRQLCEQLDPDHTTLLAARKTTTYPFLERCSERYHLPLLRFESPTVRQSVAKWIERRLDAELAEEPVTDLIWPAWVSPALDTPVANELPLRDRLLFAASDQVVVLGMRPQGHIEKLVRALVDRPASPSKTTVSLAVAPGLVSEHLAAQVPGTQRLAFEVKPTGGEQPAANGLVAGADNQMLLEAFSTSEYLIHCTRRASGPWPDQSVEDYRDSLILGRADADHSALATLARIASQRQLLTTGKAIRGAVPVVCFTAVALNQLHTLRTFRAHRGRWDFEPYGICIQKAWLEQRGARAVVYGDCELWEQLAESERPFYQRERAGKRGQIDWSQEREWRHVGDIDLADLPREAAVLFVPTPQEAQWLGPQSRWPVVVLERMNQQ